MRFLKNIKLPSIDWYLKDVVSEGKGEEEKGGSDSSDISEGNDLDDIINYKITKNFKQFQVKMLNDIKINVLFNNKVFV